MSRVVTPFCASAAAVPSRASVRVSRHPHLRSANAPRHLQRFGRARTVCRNGGKPWPVPVNGNATRPPALHRMLEGIAICSMPVTDRSQLRYMDSRGYDYPDVDDRRLARARRGAAESRAAG